MARRSRNDAGEERPTARSENLIACKLEHDALIYDKERDRATCLNAFAAQVWHCCDGSATVSDIAGRLSRGSVVPVDEKAVWLALDQLGGAALLHRHVRMPGAVLAGTSRRELLRSLGAGAAATVPAVASIVVPTAADAQSCFPDGSGCAVDGQCCSFNCNAGVCGPPLGNSLQQGRPSIGDPR